MQKIFFYKIYKITKIILDILLLIFEYANELFTYKTYINGYF